MRIEERYERQADEDIVIIGEMIDQFFKSDMGKVFIKGLNNLKSMELHNSRARDTSAEKVVGRLEAYETILADLQGFVERKNEIQKPVNRDTTESFEAEELINSPIRGGEV